MNLKEDDLVSAVALVVDPDNGDSPDDGSAAEQHGAPASGDAS